MKKSSAETRSPPLTYGGYLRLPDMLKLQSPQCSPGCHDEMLFIIVHQNMELSFKLMLHEVDSLFVLMPMGETRKAVGRFARLNEILKVLESDLGVLETMSPVEFTRFRDQLKPSSGFQSWQFREVEFAFGVRDQRYLHMFDGDPVPYRKLQRRFREASMWEAFCLLLKKYGFAVSDEGEQEEAIAKIHRDDRHGEIRMLCEQMIRLDEGFRLWRRRHVDMAERLIGGEDGTGQRLAEEHSGKAGPMGRFFPVLWTARNRV